MVTKLLTHLQEELVTKKRIFIALSVILVIILVVVIFNLINSIKITLDPGDLNIIITDASNKQVAELKGSKRLKLKNGNYQAIISNQTDKFSSSPIAFSVDDGTEEVIIRPEYSDDYYRQNFKPDIESINNIITTKYQEQLLNYDILSTHFYNRGEYAGILLTEKSKDRKSVV